MKARQAIKYIPIIIFLFILQSRFAFAIDIVNSFLSFESLTALIDTLIALVVNGAMTVTSWLLIAAGHILDVSIQLTLNIKGFVKATPAIFTVWKNLRDITGLFFIFYLLYAAIQMMTSWGKESYGSTIKNIVIAGVLINFSFFIVSFGIDASNIASQAIYNAMVPNKVIVKIDENANIKTLVDNAGKSDISNIFMNTLRIQSIYDTKGNKLGTEIKDPVKTTLIGITGVIMMITTAASFVLAALAFIARLVILLFLLAFSSIWFASSVIPQLKEAAGKFQGAFMSQLLFMPAYLLLMYVALSIINGSTIFRAGVIDGAAGGIAGANWVMPYIILLVNFAIIIFILNLPLFVALSMGGYATSWFKGTIGKWDAFKVWGNVGGWAKNRVGDVGANTVGWGASKLDKSLSNTRPGNWALGRAVRASTVGAVAKSKFGGNETYEDKVKAAKERATKRVEILRNKSFDGALYRTKNGTATPADLDTITKSLKSMNTKQKLNMGVKMLEKKAIVSNLDSADFKAIKEDKDDKFTEDEKVRIFKARDEAFDEAVKNHANVTIKDMVNNMSGEDLLRVSAHLSNPEVIEHIKTGQLKAMEDANIDPKIKSSIANHIKSLGATGHSSFGWVNKNW